MADLLSSHARHRLDQSHPECAQWASHCTCISLVERVCLVFLRSKPNPQCCPPLPWPSEEQTPAVCRRNVTCVLGPRNHALCDLSLVSGALRVLPCRSCGGMRGIGGQPYRQEPAPPPKPEQRLAHLGRNAEQARHGRTELRVRAGRMGTPSPQIYGSSSAARREGSSKKRTCLSTPAS